MYYNILYVECLSVRVILQFYTNSSILIAKKALESFSAEIMKKLRKFQYWVKSFLLN